MALFVGLDVSQRLTDLCFVDGGGKRVWRGEYSTDPKIFAETICAQAEADARVAIETGPLTPWRVLTLRAVGVDMICIQSRDAMR